jgi:hypothetical protein
MKKAYEYSKMCGADVCLGIRLRDSGRVFTFLADDSGFWSKFDASLVRMTGVSQESVLISNRKNAIPFQFARLVLILHALPTIQILRSSQLDDSGLLMLLPCAMHSILASHRIEHLGIVEAGYSGSGRK